MPLPDYKWQISYGPSDQALQRFYIPALARSWRYDRSAGYFSSTALAVAAAGIVELIRNGGTMRLLVGAELQQGDVRAIQRGAALTDVLTDKLIAALNAPEDELMHRRLEILAWMVANQTLEIRVVVPRDRESGQPIPNARDYYHVKEGLFTDADGHQMAFSGSINESVTAWRQNYEQFNVYFSWEVTQPYLAQVKARFNRLWGSAEADWVAVDIPTAVRQALLRYAPRHAPDSDPLAESAAAALRAERARQHERIAFQFLRDAPMLVSGAGGGAGVGAATSAIQAWPHQVNVSTRVIQTYPQRYMLCDEVGLGKTIEAGLILRQLIISGRVRRCLLLVPKSVMSQWQQELYEKFVLDVPIYEGGAFYNYAGEKIGPATPSNNPWDQHDFFIASSQLAKRADRIRQVTAAKAWDLIMVDEAHHARRKDFLTSAYRPNQLLTLLSDPNLRTRSLLLMTATPMQVNPIEVWDLLVLLGMKGKWAENESNFLQFYETLRTPDLAEINWDFVMQMAQDYRAKIGLPDTQTVEQARQRLGAVAWAKVDRVLQGSSVESPSQTIRKLNAPQQAAVRGLMQAYTPLRHFMFRNTRDLLRKYHEQGILKASIANRAPHAVWIDMSAEERTLYERIEEYISGFYRKYEANRVGLGFVMTIYRRRLTSSFHAVMCSLRRRLDYLERRASQWLTDEDTEQAELSDDLPENGESVEGGGLYKDEIRYVREFLHNLESLQGHDSKVAYLLNQLDQLLRTHHSVLIFTQYTDTMDHLREKLRQVYGGKVACYSGRGGEIWNGIGWAIVPKEQIKHDFRAGEKINILLCTESASEGLNLQTCGVLINHDMPWNPMRVEQRIGRIDRIGQVHPTVHIYNYFYQDTIEAQVYQALGDRISWFSDVVGPLQPILAEIGKLIERLAMLPPAEQQAALQNEIEAMRDKLDQQAESDLIGVYQAAEADPPLTIDPPVGLADLEAVFTGSATLRRQLQRHPEHSDQYVVDGQAVTFSASVFDEFPNSVMLLSYGNQIFEKLLAQPEPPTSDQRAGLLRLSVAAPYPVVAYFGVVDEQVQPVHTLRQLQAWLSAGKFGVWGQAEIDKAQHDFQRWAGKPTNQQVEIQFFATP